MLKLADTLSQRVIGQRHALEQIARRIQTSRAGLDNPSKPIGVFMLAGPSGVGKTETALALAEALYGGEQNVITINMSEFQEAHTVSTLKGAPPGYVGYGEGGVLTEAVRRRPYSVVLLDEVEKAHPDVHEIFFQVFDKGVMEDGEGRLIDFKNTIILLTTNVGSDLIMNMCKDPELKPEPDGIAQGAARAAAEGVPARRCWAGWWSSRTTRSATRCSARIIRLQLDRVAKRVTDAHGVPFDLRRRGGEADRQPLHGARERRPHDRRHPHQHAAAADQPGDPGAPRRGASGRTRRRLGRSRRLHLQVRLTHLAASPLHLARESGRGRHR